MRGGMGEDLLVARVRAPVSDTLDFMACVAKSVSRARPNAGVQENSHRECSVSAGSTRSWPTSRRAY
jgi:hypothetical protein